jgi:hypothetical protein
MEAQHPKEKPKKIGYQLRFHKRSLLMYYSFFYTKNPDAFQKHPVDKDMDSSLCLKNPNFKEDEYVTTTA